MKKRVPVFWLAVAMIIVVIFPFAVKFYCNKINEKKVEKPSYSSIITVWQLDMVEGGTGTRTSILQKTAKKVQCNGTVFSIAVHTKNSAEELMSKGVYPDIISFSNGLMGVDVRAQELNVKVPFGGYYGKKLYCAPWAVGGYVLLTKNGSKNQTCYISQNDFTQPLVAYYLSTYRYNSLVIEKPISAYTKFLGDKNGCLLGTQRDIYRLTKKGVEFNATVLSGFSDIIQYVSITTNEQAKLKKCQEFVNELCSLADEELKSIGMLSPKVDHKNLQGELSVFNEFEIKNTVSVFNSDKSLKQMQTFLAEKDVAEEEKINRIKNILQ